MKSIFYIETTSPGGLTVIHDVIEAENMKDAVAQWLSTPQSNVAYGEVVFKTYERVLASRASVTRDLRTEAR